MPTTTTTPRDASEMQMVSTTPRQPILQRAQTAHYTSTSEESHVATVARPSSSRSERSMVRPGTPGSSIGFNTEVRVERRPVTHQGMMSMRTPIQGPGRQILDKSYFLGRLRAKNHELQTEIDSMNAEIEDLQKRAPAIIQLKHHRDALLNEVKLLKGQLGDLNMVMEHVAAGVELEQLQDSLKSMKEKNDKERDEIDQLLTEQNQKEIAIRSVKEELLLLEAELKQQLDQQEPEKRAKFREIQEQSLLVTDEVEILESQLAELTLSIQPLEQELANASPEKQKAVALTLQLRKAEEELQQMKAKYAHVIHLTPEESREAMLSKIRQDNAEIARVEEDCQALESEIKTLEETLATADKALRELEGAKAKKFLEMQDEDKEMQSFMDNCETMKQEHVTATQLVQQRIEYLLEHAECSDADKDIDKDNISGDDSQSIEALTKELEARRAELKQFEDIEAKTAKEVEAAKQKIASLKADLEKFTCLDELRLASETKCSKLEAEKKAIDEQRFLLQAQLKEQKATMESMQRKLNDDDLHKNIETLNQKLRAVQQNVLETQEELEMKERELNYKPVLENIRFMVSQLNVEIKSKLQR